MVAIQSWLQWSSPCRSLQILVKLYHRGRRSNFFYFPPISPFFKVRKKLLPVRSEMFFEVLTVCGTERSMMFQDGIRGSRNPKIEKIPKKICTCNPLTYCTWARAVIQWRFRAKLLYPLWSVRVIIFCFTVGFHWSLLSVVSVRRRSNWLVTLQQCRS